MRRTISLLALAGLAWAAALAAAAAPASLSVRLVAPRGGETLAAGSLAEIAWEPLASFGRSHPLPEIEEWEAFLSLDGGGHYTVRVTPHLDRDLRRAVWRVPAIPTRDARLLLRFGDEREETVVELPQRFAIAVQPAESSSHDLAPERLALTSGEPARPGEAGIVSWVEG